MKRYIRLLDNSLVDLIKLKEMFNKNRYTLYEDDKLIGIFDTLDECLVEYFYKYEIIAESDNITDLIMVGDLVRYELCDGIIDLGEELIEISCYGDLVFTVSNIKRETVKIKKLYTKQSDNYILVWDKERGVI